MVECGTECRSERRNPDASAGFGRGRQDGCGNSLPNETLATGMLRLYVVVTNDQNHNSPAHPMEEGLPPGLLLSEVLSKV